MSRRRFDYRTAIAERDAGSAVSVEDLGRVQSHLSVAFREVCLAVEVCGKSHGFRCEEVDRVNRVHRDLGNLLFVFRNMRSVETTGDAEGYLVGSMGSR